MYSLNLDVTSCPNPRLRPRVRPEILPRRRGFKCVTPIKKSSRKMRLLQKNIFLALRRDCRELRHRPTERISNICIARLQYVRRTSSKHIRRDTALSLSGQRIAMARLARINARVAYLDQIILAELRST